MFLNKTILISLLCGISVLSIKWNENGGSSDVINLSERDVYKLKQIHQMLSMGLENLRIVQGEETIGRKYQIRKEDLQKKYAQGRIFWLIGIIPSLIAGITTKICLTPTVDC